MVLIGGGGIMSGDMLDRRADKRGSVYALQRLTSLMMVSFVFVMIMIAEALTMNVSTKFWMKYRKWKTKRMQLRKLQTDRSELNM